MNEADRKSDVRTALARMAHVLRELREEREGGRRQASPEWVRSAALEAWANLT